MIGLLVLLIALAGALYLAIAAWQLAAFAKQPLELASEFLPSFTILKPIAGLEPELYENLASFCDQEYEQFYEVVFCLHAATDPARAVVEQVAAAFPAANARVVFGDNLNTANPKIANLDKPGVDVRGEIIVIADSDVRVGREYLRALASSFSTEYVGAATCLYHGSPNASLVSRLGALYIDDGFAPSVLVALMIGKLRFCMGATMAVRRSVLAEIGGLAALGKYLADDHALGELVNQHGHRVVLSRYVVGTAIPETKLAALWSHELRWARTNFALAPPGYAFSFLMYALPFGILYLALSRNVVVGLPLLALIVGLRVTVHCLARKALRVRRRDGIWLIPLRDFLNFAIWFASFFGRRVRWRENTYRSAGRL